VLTTDLVMGLNSLFLHVTPKARGYKTVEHMTIVLYLVTGKLTLLCYLTTENNEGKQWLPAF
jgi:hypothetical protein